MKKRLFRNVSKEENDTVQDSLSKNTNKEIEQCFSLVCEQLVSAFVESHIPVMNENIADEIWTIDRLRLYFSAYLLPKMPDPLPQYIMRLNDEGFQLCNTSFGVPGILTRRKRAD